MPGIGSPAHAENVPMENRDRYADIAEIFSSIQGEGVYVGRRQIFIRFCGCNLNCRYCDTEAAARVGQPFQAADDVPTRCLAEPAPGRPAVEHENPIAANDLAKMVSKLNKPTGLHQAISITGGEPLLHAGYLLEALGPLRELNLPIHLETNGSLPDELERIADLIDVVAMDVKIESATGEPPRFDANRRFLAVAARREVFIKVVFSDSITDAEIDEIIGIAEAIERPVPVILQPVTPRRGVAAPGPATMFAVQRKLAARGVDSRIIPQVHLVLGVK